MEPESSLQYSQAPAILPPLETLPTPHPPENGTHKVKKSNL
jgi:hypothetical protein